MRSYACCKGSFIIYPTISTFARSGNTAYVISKVPVTDVMVISEEEITLQPSAGKRYVD